MFGGNFAYVMKDISLSLKQLILEIMASRMVTSDLSYNFLEGAIPESLGELTSLQRLNLNGNRLSGSVPASLGGRLLHRASFNFTDNRGLCGIPGLPSCGRGVSGGDRAGIGLGVNFMAVALVLGGGVSLLVEKVQQHSESSINCRKVSNILIHSSQCLYIQF
ncbi:uncharacterized protein [Arachis hypogaea]|uniref:uncharacterized protein n=1 Tax=Arachis hypogaea TaxID=3818 RepID=UPI000DECADD2|nr:receptor-like protein 4 [Arachis hypogaea]